MRPFLLLALCCLSRAGHAIQNFQRDANWTVGQTVQTSSGPVSGHASTNASQVSEYLGIPYAIPPLGELRFAAPQAYTGNSSINGTKFGFSCPANPQASAQGSTSNLANVNLTASGFLILSALSQFGEQFSEDCLTLNVWTKPQVGEAKKAVLVWIHGGGFSTGSSASPAYTGQYISDQEDIVLVSINYRLNIFGFPGNPSGTNNIGLLDQRLAIEWVYANIASFGGDPSRITLFGQSAGGASVDYYSYAWTANPLITGIISESGTAVGLGQQSAVVAAARWFTVSSRLGCGNATTSNSSVIACMRSQNMTSILAAMPGAGPPGAGSSNFGPAIDEAVVFSNYLARSATGNFIKVPLIVGNTDYEAGLFKVTSALGGKYYPEIFWTLLDLQTFTCPSAARANMSISNKVPTWRYRWFGDFPNTALTLDSGAWHASEIPLIFNTVPYGTGIPGNIPNETEIGNYIRGAWATFAKDPVNGLKSYGGNGGWPVYDFGKKTLVRLAYMNYTGPNLALGDQYDAHCNSTFAVISNGTSVLPSTTTSTSVSPTGTATGAGESTSPTPTKSAGVETIVGWNNFGAVLMIGIAFAWLI